MTIKFALMLLGPGVTSGKTARCSDGHDGLRARRR